MSLLGSLFGGGSKLVRAPFSAYGKLPIYKDFLRHGLAAEEVQAFRQWLDRGMSRHWDGDPVCRDHPIGATAFSLRFAGLARRVVGCLWGSTDQGALRRFPFALFVSLPVGGGLGDLSAIHSLARIADRAADLEREARQADGPEGFYRRLREAVLEVPMSPEREIREGAARAVHEVTIGRFAESLYGDRAPALWPALLAYLRRRRAAAPDRSRGAPALACRLPLSPLLPAQLQAELWAAALLPPGERGKSPWNVFLPWGEGADLKGGLAVLERDLRPDDVFAFHPEPPAYDFLEDLRHAVPGAGEPSTAASPPTGWNQPLAALLAPAA